MMTAQATLISAHPLRYHNFVLYPPMSPSFGPFPAPGVHFCPRTVHGHPMVHVADETDCAVFYHCQDAGIFGTVMVRKDCGVGLMFNIETGKEHSQQGKLGSNL